MSTLDRNHAIKEYIHGLFVDEDEHLTFAKENSLAQGLPDIHVPAHVGKFIYLLAKIRAPKKVLEIGTLGGYSTLWLARALTPDGKLTSLELNPHHVHLAQQHIAKAGFASQVDVRQGPAFDLLHRMIAQREEPFDLIFIDADKENYPAYLELALALSKPGTLILSDNLIPKGDPIGKPTPTHQEGVSIYQFNQEIAKHPRLESVLATTIVGNHGRVDAIGLSIVRNT